MRLGICSFSFHRLLSAGEQDMFQYIEDCRQLGCTQLDPWNAHLATLKEGDALHAGANPDQAHRLETGDDQYIERVRRAAEEAGLPFGCIAVDGAHIYEADEEKARANRARAYRWIAIAEKLGAEQIRIDAGGPEEMPEEAFDAIVAGYWDLVPRCRDSGIELLVENHWGPTRHPENLVRILEAVDGLGLLFDTWNWAPGKQAQGWLQGASHARHLHAKTFHFTQDGEELTQHIGNAVKLLQRHGYRGPWCIESVPQEEGEIEGARRTAELLRRYVEA
jgi:sugar phosphate isomerase/epimerase